MSLNGRTKYPYQDADGSPAFIIERMDNADGSKEIKGSIPDKYKQPRSSPLFHLPEIIGNPNTDILLVEGEKCACVEVPEMILATWRSGAASHHLTDFSPLFGRIVYLWPDKDDNGFKAMQAIGNLLKENESTVYYITPPEEKPEKWDIADASAEGEDIQKIIDEAEEFKPSNKEEEKEPDEDEEISIQTLLEMELPARQWYSFFTPGTTLVSAKKAIGKSLFCLQAAKALSEGKEFLGTMCDPVHVLYISTELDKPAIQERAKKFGSWAGLVYFRFGVKNGYEGLDQIERRVQTGGYKVVFLDMLMPLIPAEEKKGSGINNYSLSDFYLALRKMGQRNGCAIVATWHNRKAGADDDFMDAPSGSMGLVGQADVIISLERKRGDSITKVNIGGNHAEGRTLHTVFENCQFTLLGEAEEKAKITQNEYRILSLVDNAPDGTTIKEIAKELNKTDDAVRKAVSRLRTKGYIGDVNGKIVRTDPNSDINVITGQDRTKNGQVGFYPRVNTGQDRTAPI